MTDDVELSEELLKQVMESQGREYSTGSQYDINMNGPTVKIKEYDSDGILKSESIYYPEEKQQPKYQYDTTFLNEQRKSNKRKSFIFNLVIAFMLFTTVGGLIMLWYVLKLLKV